MKKIHPYLLTIRDSFQQESNPDNAKWAAAYMRNQFTFFGLKSPARRRITKEILKRGLPDQHDLREIIQSAWLQPEREFQYFGIELLQAFNKKWEVEIISLFEKMILEKSWWDTVDAIASGLNAPYFLKFPARRYKVTGAWNHSENIWLQRSSLLFQLPYKSRTDTDLLEKYILHLRDTDEFFIQKAIGWILRQYARANPQWVKDFVHQNELPALSKKEAMKHL